MPPGRYATPIQWTPVSFHGKDLIVGKVKFKDSYIYCINDAEDKFRLKMHNWYVVTGSYMGCYALHNNQRKTRFMHNYIMERESFNGKGQDETVDHINGVGFDNRRCNLRLISQSLQNMNTKQRTRTTTQLPEGIDPSEIPRNIWYIPPSETHGDRFVVEVKGIPDVGDICKKTTSSRTVSSKNKLEEAIKIRNDIFKKYPVLVEYSRDAPQSIRLKKEYENIIAIAKNETPPHFLEEPVMEPVKLVEPLVEPVEPLVELVEPVEPVKPVESVKVPKQWKTRDIYDFIKNNKEHHYKLYCEASNDLSKLPTWNTMWSSFLEHVKGATWEVAEDLIRSFVEELRRIRHNSLCAAKKNVLDREDRQVWPAETVDKLFL